MMSAMASEPVILNVYDMYWINSYIGGIGIGIYHTGVEVYGSEYSYGGHPLGCSGIFKTEPKDAEELGDNFKFRETLVMGTTDFTHDEIEKLIIHSGQEFRGDKYHLMNKNCNHFSSFLTKILCGREIPRWVNRLAFMSTCVPFLERCLPKEWLTPVALQQSLDMQQQQLLLRCNERDLSSRSSVDQSGPSTSSLTNVLNTFRGFYPVDKMPNSVLSAPLPKSDSTARGVEYTTLDAFLFDKRSLQSDEISQSENRPKTTHPPTKKAPSYDHNGIASSSRVTLRTVGSRIDHERKNSSKISASLDNKNILSSACARNEQVSETDVDDILDMFSKDSVLPWDEQRNNAEP